MSNNSSKDSELSEWQNIGVVYEDDDAGHPFVEEDTIHSDSPFQPSFVRDKHHDLLTRLESEESSEDEDDETSCSEDEYDESDVEHEGEASQDDSHVSEGGESEGEHVDQTDDDDEDEEEEEEDSDDDHDGADGGEHPTGDDDQDAVDTGESNPGKEEGQPTAPDEDDEEERQPTPESHCTTLVNICCSNPALAGLFIDNLLKTVVGQWEPKMSETRSVVDAESGDVVQFATCDLNNAHSFAENAACQNPQRMFNIMLLALDDPTESWHSTLKDMHSLQLCWNPVVIAGDGDMDAANALQDEATVFSACNQYPGNLDVKLGSDRSKYFQIGSRLFREKETASRLDSCCNSDADLSGACDAVCGFLACVVCLGVLVVYDTSFHHMVGAWVTLLLHFKYRNGVSFLLVTLIAVAISLHHTADVPRPSVVSGNSCEKNCRSIVETLTYECETKMDAMQEDKDHCVELYTAQVRRSRRLSNDVARLRENIEALEHTKVLESKLDRALEVCGSWCVGLFD